MNISFRSRGARAAAAGALSVALVTAGSAEAFAAAPPSPKPHMTRTMTPRTAASITLTASPTTVKAGRTVRFTGRTTGIRTGASVVLQQERQGRWRNLRTSTTVKKGRAFALTTRPVTKGTLHYRVASGTTHSPTVTVTVQ